MSYARRTYDALVALIALAIIALTLAWIYIRHGEDAFHTVLGKMVRTGLEP